MQGVVKAGFKDAAHPSRHEPPLQTMAAIELAKCGIAIGLLYRGTSTRLNRDTRYTSLSEEVLPLYSALDEHSAAQDVDARRNTDLGTPRCTARYLYMAAMPLACLYLGRHQLVRLSLQLTTSVIKCPIFLDGSSPALCESIYVGQPRCLGDFICWIIHLSAGGEDDSAETLDEFFSPGMSHAPSTHGYTHAF